MTEPPRIRVTSLEQLDQLARDNRRVVASAYDYKPQPAKAWMNKRGNVILSAIQTGLWVHEETK